MTTITFRESEIEAKHLPGGSSEYLANLARVYKERDTDGYLLEYVLYDISGKRCSNGLC